MRVIGSTIVVVAALSQLGSTDCGAVIRDSGFDLWCGDELCAWKIERGDIKRVPTWNEGDSGVELVGADVAIEQLSPVNSGDGECLRFELVANVDDRAEAYVIVDVQGDGTAEIAERLPTSHWKPLSYRFRIARPYDSVRFEITKRGPGTAMLANIGATVLKADECDGLTALDPGPRRNGAACGSGTDCASGLCMESPTPVSHGVWPDKFVCVGCDHTMPDSCGAGTVCGLGEPFSPVFAEPVECIAPAIKELGESCLGDGECASGICFVVDGLGACSSCRDDDRPCANNQLCLAAGDSGYGPPPHVCGGGKHVAPAGAPCASDDDCASTSCAGALREECDTDGRPCTSPAACPFVHLQNTACITVGIQGGTCQ